MGENLGGREPLPWLWGWQRKGLGESGGRRDYRGDNSEGDQGRTRSRAELVAGKPNAETNGPGTWTEPEKTKKLGGQ
ncbi:hypothetical protein M9458_041446, partial [Cirrhinus mrigala]